jgi:hypothetical protein
VSSAYFLQSVDDSHQWAFKQLAHLTDMPRGITFTVTKLPEQKRKAVQDPELRNRCH